MWFFSSKLWFWLIVTCILGLVAGLIGMVFYLEGPLKEEFSSMPEDTTYAGLQAVYLDHAWVDGARPNDFPVLTQRLRDGAITDVFVHVGPLEYNGTIPATRFVYAKEFTDMLHTALPKLRVHAWIGQVEKAWGGPLDMDDPVVHDNIARTANILINNGFDGIHLNIEPVFSGSTSFLQLLDELQYLRRNGKSVGIALDDIEPFPFARFLWVLYGKRISLITTQYVATLEPLVDHISVMTYDAGLPQSHYYALLVALQTKAMAAFSSVDVFIGIPTYEKGGPRFDPRVENITQGIIGIKRALAELPADTKHIGVALYAYWETDKEEWEDFLQFWIGKK